MYRAHLEKTCTPSHVQQEAVDQVSSLLSRHAQLYDATFVEDQCTRVKAWAYLVVRQGFVVKAEQQRIKKEKEKESPKNSGISSGGVRSYGCEKLRRSLAT